MVFAPIEVDDYIALHMSRNPDEDRAGLLSRLHLALDAHRAGERCNCGNPIWVIGSAAAGHACFVCISGEADPDGDYEIAEACRGNDV
jgi:hypothetical protein